MDNDIPVISPYLDLVLAFFLSSLCGLAAWLRSNEAYSFRAIVSSTLNGGCIGVVICGIGLRYFLSRYDLWMLMGICALAGLGGPKMAEFGSRMLEATFFKFFADKGIRDETPPDKRRRR